MTNEKDHNAIDYILGQLKYGYIDLSRCWDQNEFDFVKSTVLKQIPQKPIHIHEVYEEHDWQRDKNGEIDTWAYEYGYCNGPICTRCFRSECVHCNPEWETDPTEYCIVDEDRCPTCNNTIAVVGKFCIHCGQALEWGELQ